MLYSRLIDVTSEQSAPMVHVPFIGDVQ